MLPFDIVGVGDADTCALADGLAADLTSRLSLIKGLVVAPRTSTRALAGQTIREIAARLDVGMVLEGTVQRSDRRVRVNATLVDAAHEAPLCPSMVVEAALDEPLATQAEIARDVWDTIAVGRIAHFRPSGFAGARRVPRVQAWATLLEIVF